MNTFTNYKKIELKQLKKNTIRTAIVESSTCFNAYASWWFNHLSACS